MAINGRVVIEYPRELSLIYVLKSILEDDLYYVLALIWLSLTSFGLGLLVAVFYILFSFR